MSTLLKLKQADFLVQSIATAIPLISLAVTGSIVRFTVLIYLITLSVQGISCIANLRLPEHFRHGARRIYQVVLLGLLLLILPGLIGFTGILGAIGVGLYYVAPVMVLWYLYISYLELRQVKRQSDRAKYTMVNS